VAYQSVTKNAIELAGADLSKLKGNKRRSKGVAMSVFDDGLPCPEVGKWADDKHSLVSLYAKLFSTGMKDKWDERVYIELYAGAGCSKIRDTSTTIAGSPLRALKLDHSFDKYIFCEQQPALLEALRKRVDYIAPSANVVYVPGDCNEQVGEILAAIPLASKEHTVLTLCFVDPYDIGIKFGTLSALSARYVDFLVLLALHMDANKNYANYIRPESLKVAGLLGSTTWRDRWGIAQSNAVSFPRFLAQEFANSMASIGYLPLPLYKMKEVRSDEKNLPLYHLALFSRSELAYKYWDEVLKYSTDQTSLF
jgi:three-Cys-motif partner protein